MKKADSYEAWRAAAIEHDGHSGADEWKASDSSKNFDYRTVRRRLESFQEMREKGDDVGLIYAINEGIHGNMDGMGNSKLFDHAQFGTKQLIEDYVDIIVDTLEYLASPDVDIISDDKKIDLFRRARHCYGSSALLLSGSGAFMYFHVGVAKAFWEQGVLPQTMSGASGGAFVGSMLCTRTDKQLSKIFDPKWLHSRQLDKTNRERKSIWSGNFATTKELYGHFSRFIPDLTFAEAYERTGRHLNISISPSEQHQSSRLLNAITAPNVFIREAVLASSSLPGIFSPVGLMAKNHDGKKVPYLPNRRWVDGSMSNDIPAKRLARLYGVNHHIVSQANPLVSGLAVDISRKDEPLQVVRDATMKSGITWMNASAALWRSPLERLPRVNSAVNLMLSIANQEYLGDVNIIRPKYKLPAKKHTEALDLKDIKALVSLGERTTWPKIEMVRTQTKISRTLDDILDAYGEAGTTQHFAL